MFKMTFVYLDKTYTASVEKITLATNRFIVSNVNPEIPYLPNKLVFVSNPSIDQLIYQSFDIKYRDVLTIIGQSIFIACYEQRIKVHG